MFRRIIGILLAVFISVPPNGFSQGNLSFASSWIVEGNPSSAQVVVIEDLHYSQECQRSIVNTVFSLVKKRRAQAIFLEGALEGKIDLEVWQRIVREKKAKKAIYSLWKKGKLTAGEYLSFRLLDEIEFRGLENPRLYFEHLHLMRDWVPTLEVVKKDIYPVKFWKLAKKRDEEFSRELLDYIHTENPSLVLVIVGGYHAKTIVPKLVAESISVAWLRPKVYSLSNREKEMYFTSFLSLDNTLALPIRVDYRVSSTRFWQLWYQVVRNIEIGGKLEHPLRLPYPLWEKLSEIVKKVDLDLYYLLKGKGFTWTDYTGKVHTIDEIICFCDEKHGKEVSAFLWALLAKELAAFYHKRGCTVSEGKKFAENMAFLHEKLHWLLINEPSIRKKMLSSAKQVLGNKLSAYVDWTMRVYGRPPRRFKLKRKREVDWCLEELLVISYQEYFLRSSLLDYASALEELGVGLPEGKGKFVKRIQSLASLWQPYEKFITKVRISMEKYEIDWFKTSIASLSSKKIKKLAELVLRYCEGKKFPEGESYIHHVSSLFTFVRAHRSRDFRLAAMSLVHIMDLPEAEQVLVRAGFSKKEVTSLIRELEVYKLIFEFPYSFDETKPLPSPDFLNNLNEYLYQVIKLNHAISGFRLAAYDLLVSLSEEGVLYEKEKDRYLKLAKYLIIPLAERLGANWLFFELKDMLYRYEHPGVYYSTLARVREGLKGKTEQEFADEIITKVYSAIPELNEYKYSWRMKSVSSIVEKQRRRKLDISGINDIFGMKIIVPYRNQARDVAKRLASSFSVPIEERKVKGGSYFILQFRHNSFPCEIQIRDNKVEEILERTHLAHWRYNLKKSLPLAWMSQQFKSYNWQKNPVLFLVKTNITPRRKNTSQWQLVRFSTLKEKYNKLLSQAERLYIFSPYEYLFSSHPSTREELDLRYFSPKRVLSRIKEQPDAIFVYSNKLSLYEILQWMRTWFDSTTLYKQLLFIGFFLSQVLTGHLFGLHYTDSIPWMGMLLGTITLVPSFPVVWKTKDGRKVEVRLVDDGRLKLMLDGVQYTAKLLDLQGDLILNIADDFPLPLLEVLAENLSGKLKESNLLFLRFKDSVSLESKIEEGLLVKVPFVRISENVLVYAPQIRDIILFLNWFGWKNKQNMFDLIPISDWVSLLRSRDRQEFVRRFRKIYLEELKQLDIKSDTSFTARHNLRFLEESLKALEKTWMKLDIKRILQDLIALTRSNYPDCNVRVKNKINFTTPLYSYGFVPYLMEEIAKFVFSCGGKDLMLEFWVQEGRLYGRMKAIGKNIDREKLTKMLSTDLANNKKGLSLPLLIRDLRQIGGNIRITLLSEESGRRDDTLRFIGLRREKGDLSPFVTIEFSIPAWHMKLQRRTNKFSVMLMKKEDANKINWKARSYASKYGLYYLSLDDLTTFLISKLLLEHKGLWHLILTDDWNITDKVLPVIIKKELSLLKITADGIYWKGINLDWEISNPDIVEHLNPYLSWKRKTGLKTEERIRRVAQKISKLVYHYVQQEIIPQIKTLGFNGIVIVGSAYIFPKEESKKEPKEEKDVLQTLDKTGPDL